MTIENAKACLDSAQAISGATLSLKWVEPPRAPALAELETYHKHPVCLSMKSTLRGLALCKRDCQFALAQIVDKHKPYHERTCHGGVREWLFPVMSHDSHERLLGVLCVGPLHGSTATKGTALRQEWVALFQATCLSIATCYHAHVIHQTPTRQSVSDVIQRACDYMAAHYAKQVSVEDIASHCHLSASRLMHRFREETGTTLSDYLLRTRLSRAKERLQRSDEPIGVIARSVGMANQTYFGQRFKADTGLTPRAYRKSHHRHILP